MFDFLPITQVQCLKSQTVLQILSRKTAVPGTYCPVLPLPREETSFKLIILALISRSINNNLILLCVFSFFFFFSHFGALSIIIQRIREILVLLLPGPQHKHALPISPFFQKLNYNVGYISI